MSGFALYNGVKLPKLPEWDKSEFPYAVINGTALFLFKIAPKYSTYTLSNGTTYTQPSVFVPSGESTQYVYYRSVEGSVENGWELAGTYTYSAEGYSVGRHLGISHLVWTNTDIPNLDTGGTYMAATTPIPLEASFTSGFLLGLVSRGQVKGRVPVAYLYNGVQLPKLPSVDRSVYPYCIITHSTVSTTERYKVHFWASMHTAIHTDYTELWTLFGDYPKLYTNTGIKAGATEWGELSEGAYSTGSIAITDSPEDYILWSSHTFYDENGEEWITASDPVPVYE